MNYIKKNKKNCKLCPELHPNICSLRNNDFFLSLVMKNAIYCSIHKNKIANYLVLGTLEAMCEKCKNEIPDEKIQLNNPKISVSNILNETFVKRSKNPEFLEKINTKTIEQFSILTNQEKVDKIKEGIKPERRDTLRSVSPKGRPIAEIDTIGNSSFLYRFMSVVPPFDFNEEFIFMLKPWVLDCEKSQVEALVFSCNNHVQLCGVGIGQALNMYETSTESIEIRNGKSLLENPVWVDEKKYQFNHRGEIQDIIFNKPFDVSPGHYYNIKIKLKGELLFRGNPFDLKEIQVGSDGTVFEFSEPENVGDYFVNGQHDINGPIIKLIYQRL